MNTSPTSLTPTELIATASQTLIDGGYQQIARRFQEWDTSSSRLFEDEYSVVGVVVFETSGELLNKWPDLQGLLVEVLSQHIGREESKAWDGYLVLLSSGLGPSEGTAIEAIRSNTTRLRKLVATGDDLRSPADVERVLRPLLPLDQEQAKMTQTSALDLLPSLLADKKVPKEITQGLIDAFRDQSPLLERLHQLRGAQ